MFKRGRKRKFDPDQESFPWVSDGDNSDDFEFALSNSEPKQQRNGNDREQDDVVEEHPTQDVGVDEAHDIRNEEEHDVREDRATQDLYVAEEEAHETSGTQDPDLEQYANDPGDNDVVMEEENQEVQDVDVNAEDDPEQYDNDAGDTDVVMEEVQDGNVAEDDPEGLEDVEMNHWHDAIFQALNVQFGEDPEVVNIENDSQELLGGEHYVSDDDFTDEEVPNPAGGDPFNADDDDGDDPEDPDLEEEFEQADDYHALLKFLAKKWLDTELTHHISKEAGNALWDLGKKWFHRLFQAKEAQNVRRKTPAFVHIRRKMYTDYVPPIHMDFGYEHKDTGEITIVKDSSVTPTFPNHQKNWEIGHVQV